MRPFLAVDRSQRCLLSAFSPVDVGYGHLSRSGVQGDDAVAFDVVAPAGRRAAVDADVLAGDPGRLVGGEVHGQVSDVDALARALDEVVVDLPGAADVVDGGVGRRGRHEAWGDRVRPNAVSGTLDGERT